MFETSHEGVRFIAKPASIFRFFENKFHTTESVYYCGKIYS